MQWKFISETFENEIDLNEDKQSKISFSHDKVSQIADCEEIHKAKVEQDFDKVNIFYYSSDDINIRSKYSKKCEPHPRKDQIKCDEGKYLDEVKYNDFIENNRNDAVANDDVCLDHPATLSCSYGQLFDADKFEAKRKSYKGIMNDDYIQTNRICYDDPDYVRLKQINDDLKLKKIVDITQKDVNNMLNHYYDVFRV